MKFDPVFLLVVAACLLMVFLPIFGMPLIGKKQKIPKPFRSRKRRKVLLGQLTVVVFLIATAATLVWPIGGIQSLIQGVLLSAIVLVPAFVLNLFVSLYFGSDHSETSVAKKSDVEDWFDPDENFFEDDSIEGLQKPNSEGVFEANNFDRETSVNAPMNFGTERMSVIHLPADAKNSDSQKAKPLARKPIENVAALSGIPRPFRNVEMNSEPNVEEQVQRESESVASHDWGAQKTVSLHEYRKSDSQTRKGSSPTPQFSQMASIDGNATELESMELSQISGLVTSLKTDNRKLQRLVIAQHAVIESERASNSKSKDLAREAVRVMQEAQSNLKIAEKIARREKTQRQRIENDYQKVTTVFENAMSIISLNRETSLAREGS